MLRWELRSKKSPLWLLVQTGVGSRQSSDSKAIAGIISLWLCRSYILILYDFYHIQICEKDSRIHSSRLITTVLLFTAEWDLRLPNDSDIL